MATWIDRGGGSRVADRSECSSTDRVVMVCPAAPRKVEHIWSHTCIGSLRISPMATYVENFTRCKTLHNIKQRMYASAYFCFFGPKVGSLSKARRRPDAVAGRRRCLLRASILLYYLAHSERSQRRRLLFLFRTSHTLYILEVR